MITGTRLSFLTPLPETANDYLTGCKAELRDGRLRSDLPHSRPAPPRPRQPRSPGDPHPPARAAQPGSRNGVSTEFHLRGGCLSCPLRLNLRWDSKHGPGYTLFRRRGVSLPFPAELPPFPGTCCPPPALERGLSVCNTQPRSDGSRPRGAGVGAGVGTRLRSSLHFQLFALLQFPSRLSGRVERDDRRICHSLGKSPPEQPSA